MKLLVIFLILNILFPQIHFHDTPPTLEEIANDPSSTIDEISYYNNRQSLLNEDNEKGQQLLKEFGFDKEKSLVMKNDFKDFLFRLVTVEEADAQQEKEFYTKVIEHFTTSVPEVFPSKEIKKYLDSEEFQESFKAVIIELYGEDTYKEFNNLEVGNENNTGTSAEVINENMKAIDGQHDQEVSSKNQTNTTRKLIHSDL